MHERKFNIIDEMNHVLAKDMDFDMALVFMKGYYREFYNQTLELTIKECERTEQADE